MAKCAGFRSLTALPVGGFGACWIRDPGLRPGLLETSKSLQPVLLRLGWCVGILGAWQSAWRSRCRPGVTVRPREPGPARRRGRVRSRHQCGTSLRDVEKQEPACPPPHRPARVKDDAGPLLNGHERPANSLVPHVAERRATLEAATPGHDSRRAGWPGPVSDSGAVPGEENAAMSHLRQSRRLPL